MAQWSQLTELRPGTVLLVGGDRTVEVPADIAAAFAPGDAILAVEATGEVLHVPAAERRTAGDAVSRAQAAFWRMGAVTDAPDFPALRDALLRGYERHAPLPASQMPYLDHFIAGRFALLALYVAAAAVQNPELRGKGEAWIARFFKGARRFLPSA